MRKRLRRESELKGQAVEFRDRKRNTVFCYK